MRNDQQGVEPQSSIDTPPGGDDQYPDPPESPPEGRTPTAKSKKGAIGCLAIVIVVVVGIVILMVFDTPIEISSEESAQRTRQASSTQATREAAEVTRKAQQIVDCITDLQCARERDDWRIAAEILCGRQIEDLARFDYDWTNGFGEPKFSRIALAGTDALLYKGDRLQFQNGFGAWQRMTYSCIFNPIDEHVIEVAVDPYG